MSENRTKERSSELLARAQKLKAHIKGRQAKLPESDDGYSLAELQRDVGIITQTLSHIKQGLSWIKPKVVQPIITAMPFLRRIWSVYQDLWQWFCYPRRNLHQELVYRASSVAVRVRRQVTNLLKPDSSENVASTEEEPGEFSRSRAGIFIFFTFLFMSWPLHVPFLNDISYAIFYEPVYDASRMGANMLLYGGKIRVERLYLNGKNEISPEDNYWSINGCESERECNPEDAVYFRVKPSLVHFIWSLTTKGLPFIADDVAGVVPNVPSECIVKSYGSRWRIMKWMQSYPVALDVKCEMPRR